MSKCARILAIAATLLVARALPATDLTGTFKKPDGSLVNGKLILRLSQTAKLSDNSAQVVPMVKIFSVTSGALESGAFIYGNDVLLPTGTYYLARLVDDNNNVLFEQKWSITGTSLDLGTLTPTSTGVALVDPLVRNVLTSQIVQGPVTFSSPITVLSLTLGGNLGPGAPAVYDLGSPTLPWRHFYTHRWNGNVVPTGETLKVNPPATAPAVATDSTTGGSLDNTTRYLRFTLLTLNGETPPSPAQTYTPTTCSGGACKLSVNVTGQEWYQGAFAYRVYACTDATDPANCARQSGFPDELDTTGALASAHYSPGSVILSTVSFSGPAPPVLNTALVDTDQVSLNEVCFAATNICAGTLQYKENPSPSTPSQVGTTPLVLARAGTRVRGHGSESIDITAHGSTRSCDFSSHSATTRAKIGCVMIMNVNGVDVEGLNVSAAGTNAVMLTTWGSSYNLVRWRRSTLSATGSIAIAPLRIQGIWYYLEFDNNLLYANLSGTGANKGAAVLISNASGANWRFTGKSRWTVNTFADAIRNDLGKTDRDRGISTSFPTMVGEFLWRDVQVQWSPQSGSPQGQLVRGGGLSLRMDGVTHSDYVPASGTGPLIEIGFDSDGAAASGKNYRIANSSTLQAHANNAAFLKNLSNSSGGALEVDGVNPNGDIDLNHHGLQLFIRNIPAGAFSCNANAAQKRIINAPATAAIHCEYGANNGISAERISNHSTTGGFTIHDDSNRANARYWYWPSSGNLGMYLADPLGGAANQIVEFIAGKRTAWRNNSGSAILFDIDARSGVDVVQLGGPLRPAASASHPLGSSSLRWAGVWSTTGDYSGVVTSSVATGTAPFTIASTTEVANLNTQKWHGKDALDFSSVLDFGSIAAQSCAELTISVSGATVDNPIASAWPTALEAGLTGVMYVSAANTVSVRLCNITASAVDPASRTFSGRVIK